MTSHKQWHVADLHLGHKLMYKPEHRGEGFEKKFFEVWDNCVADKDIVYIHGDMAFASQAFWFNKLSQRPGRKIMLKGNHDKNKDNWYKKWGFEEVIPFNDMVLIRHDYGPIMLTHIPAFASVLTTYDERFKNLSYKFQRLFEQSGCILNIHGHTHNVAKENDRTIDVSLDATGGQLLTLEQIIERKFK